MDTIDILLVEDNAGDVSLIRDGLRFGSLSKRLNIVTDGEQALKYLARQDSYRNAGRPDLIILDLNLPKVDGRQVLELIKADPDLRYIPVVILSSSSSDVDVQGCYQNHANCYLTKPADLDQFLDVVESIENYWMNCVALPAGARRR